MNHRGRYIKTVIVLYSIVYSAEWKNPNDKFGQNTHMQPLLDNRKQSDILSNCHCRADPIVQGRVNNTVNVYEYERWKYDTLVQRKCKLKQVFPERPIGVFRSSHKLPFIFFLYRMP